MHYNLSRSHRVKPATTSPGSTMQTGLSSCTVGGLCVCLCAFVCVCVITHTLTPPPQHYLLTSILITPSLAFTRLTEFVHVSPTPACDLLPRYTTWLIDECSFDSLIASNGHENATVVAHTHITGSHWVTKLIASTRLYVCVAIYWPVRATTVSREALKMTGTLLTQMLVVRVCGFNTHPSASDKQGFSNTVMLWERKCVLPQNRHAQLQRKKRTCIISHLALIKGQPPKYRYTAVICLHTDTALFLKSCLPVSIYFPNSYEGCVLETQVTLLMNGNWER